MIKMKSLGLSLICAFALPAFAQDDLINKVKNNGSDTKGEFVFETLVDIEATPVKNQGRSGTCWSYATTSFVESEMIRNGKEPIDLSEMYTVRMVYLDKAEKYVRLHGNLNFAQGGALPDVLYVLKKYGAVPQEVYEGLDYGTEGNNHGELEALLKAQLDQVIKNPNGTLTPSWRIAFVATLDAYLGKEPKEFEWEGKTYTPRTFADEYVGVDADDYVQITSFSHKQPFYQEVMIEVPDNWTWGTSYNVPLNEMMETLDNSLNKGYSVSWATDVSESGFSLKNGLAIVPLDDSKSAKKEMFKGPKPELVVTQENRQKGYDNFSTTDDHGMQITGMVKDQVGTVYYMVKNSWGERENPNRTGFIYASESFVKFKTISILVHKDAVAKSLKRKLNF